MRPVTIYDVAMADGSQKLPVRLLPVLRAERGASRLPDVAVTVLAAWLPHRRGSGVPVRDVRADELRALAAQPSRCADLSRGR